MSLLFNDEESFLWSWNDHEKISRDNLNRDCWTASAEAEDLNTLYM